MAHAIAGTVALVTGANRGIGAATVDALVARGAKKVYATARRAASLEPLVVRHGDRVVPLTLDVTDSAQIAAAATQASDVTLLINNAGVAGLGMKPATDVEYLGALRAELDANVVGLHAVTLALVPHLTKNATASGSGAIVNLSSIAAFANFPMFPTYSASKAAVHSLTQAMRFALRDAHISVHGVYPGPVDTDMAANNPFDKTSAPDVANAILDGVEQGVEEILPDAMSVQMGAGYEAGPKGLELQVAQMASA